MTLKYAHITFVCLTFISFSLRGYWMITESDLLQHKLVKKAPHFIDALLLLTGLSMAIMFYGPFYKQTWLMTKLLAVVIYIVLGSFALKYGRTLYSRIIFLISSYVVFAYIILNVRNHSIFPF